MAKVMRYVEVATGKTYQENMYRILVGRIGTYALGPFCFFRVISIVETALVPRCSC